MFVSLWSSHRYERSQRRESSTWSASGSSSEAFGVQNHFFFHLIKILFFPLLTLKGIYHYWKFAYFFQGLKRMEVLTDSDEALAQQKLRVPKTCLTARGGEESKESFTCQRIQTH